MKDNKNPNGKNKMNHARAIKMGVSPAHVTDG
jgi:hypothetical protein